VIKGVKKVRIIVPKDKKDELLVTLQKEAIVMLPKNDESAENVNISYEDEIISRANSAIKKIGLYQKKGRKFFQHHEVKFEDFLSDINSRIKTLEKIEEKFIQNQFLEKEIEIEEKLINEVLPFNELNYTTQELSSANYISFFLGYVPGNRWDFFTDYTNRMQISYHLYETNSLGYHVLIYLQKLTADNLINQLERFGFNKVKIPIIDKKISQYISDKQKIIDNNKKMINDSINYFTQCVAEENELKILADQMLARKERKLIIYEENENDVIFDGWISNDNIKILQNIVKKITLGYQIEFNQANEFDNVPTLLKNNKFVEPFESITNTYSVPNYREIDPNPIMSIWYWIIFGLMIGDIGYGILMIVGCFTFLKYKKPKGEFAKLMKIFAYSGITSIFAGILYGSFFGVDFNLLKIIGSIFNQNWNSTLLDPINDTMTMLIFSIALGIVHLISALVMKILLSIKQKDLLTGFADGVSWILILIGISIIAISMKIKSLSIFGIIFILIGVLVLIVAKGLKQKGILGKIFGGFSGLFKVTSYLSDLLSYSRILALALSSGIIAFTMNLLAGLVNGNGSSIIGIFFSIPIYIVGHIFNFAMGLLSAYVHGSRLQYLEFYGKFYEGGGILFVPLQFNNKYINEITN